MPFPGALQAIPGAPGRFALQVDADHPAFEGHFPGAAILSGLLQVDWAIRLGRETYGITGAFRALEHLKFQAPIGPGEPLELHLDWQAAKGHLGFVYQGIEGRKSKGSAVFTPTP